MADDSFQKQWQESDRGRHHGGGPMDASTQIQMLTQRNYELTTLVTTLIDLLVESGTVDADVLLAKVENKLEVPPPKPAAKPTGPTTRCAACATEVALAQAEMTGRGLMCPRCAVSQ